MNNFFMKHYLDDQFYQLDKISPDFFDEMEKGLADESTSSLLMLPSFAMVDSDMVLNKKVVVVDAGGTNIRFAHVWFDQNGEYHNDRFIKEDMMGTNKALTKDAFFETLAKKVLPYLDETDTIAISFAYPTEITEDMDGKIITLVKELRIDGAEGCLIGKELKEKLVSLGKPNTKVFVTNDTIATAFAGKAQTIGQNFQSHVGVIVGTGMNACYPEKLDSIAKLSNHSGSERMMINTESGNFNQVKRSTVDLTFDGNTINEGYHILEKMISGGYIGGLCGAFLKEAANAGLFSDETTQNFETLDIDTRDVSMFLSNADADKLTDITETCDIQAVSAILKKVIRRASNLIALQIYCLALKCTQPGETVCIAIEGTTYYKLPGLQAQTLEFLDLYMGKADVKYKTMSVDDAVMKGCAAIGLQH